MRKAFSVILLFVLASWLLAAQTRTAADFHVSWMALPTSTAAAPVFEGGTTTTRSVNVNYIVLANTDSSSHTVTVTDNTAVTPLLILNAAPIAAATTWILPMGGSRLNGLKWFASSTTVQGAVTGTR